MTIKELISKLGLKDVDESALETAVNDYAKAQVADIEKSMQTRINGLTREKHDLKDKMSGLTAELETAKTKAEEVLKDKEAFQTKISEYEKFKEQQITQKRDRLKKIIERIDNTKSTDKIYDKVQKLKADLKLKDKIEDYTEAEINDNIRTFEIAEKYGAFGETRQDDQEDNKYVPPGVDPLKHQHTEKSGLAKYFKKKE